MNHVQNDHKKKNEDSADPSDIPPETEENMDTIVSDSSFTCGECGKDFASYFEMSDHQDKEHKTVKVEKRKIEENVTAMYSSKRLRTKETPKLNLDFEVKTELNPLGFDEEISTPHEEMSIQDKIPDAKNQVSYLDHEDLICLKCNLSFPSKTKLENYHL